MRNKKHVLVVSNDGNYPESLTQAIEQLDMEVRPCGIEAAGRFAAKKDGPVGAVLALDHLGELQDAGMQLLTEQLEDVSINILVLAGEVDKGTQLPLCEQAKLFYANSDESAEMLKGRIATLIDMQHALKQLNNELLMLRHTRQPLDSHFASVTEEMQLAARLQRDFLPKQMPEIEGIRFARVFRPACWVSGDMYDVMRLDENHVGFYIADAVGHGMPAALLTMFIKRAMVTKRIEGSSYSIIEPGEALAQLNDDMMAQNLSNFQFATCSYGILNTKTLKLRIAGAGHPAPIYITQSDQRELTTSGSLLGVFADQSYETFEYQLETNSKLVMYSDGVEVAFENAGPDEPLRFGEEFGNLTQYGVDTICEKLVEIIEREEGSLHPRDDVTIVALELS